MAEILTDAKFNIMDITDNLYINGVKTIDKDRILYINEIYANKINYTFLENSDSKENTVTTNSSFGTSQDTILLSIQGINNISYTNSVTIGGEFNEAISENSTCIGGKGNEANGMASTTLGGTENQSIGLNSVSCGKNAISAHDNTFVFNSSDTATQSSNVSQFVVGADNGLLFKLPYSSTIHTHEIPNGFAIWCWDKASKNLCLKTKQNNIFYKTDLPTNTHEIKVSISTEGVILTNPDDS